MPRKYFHGPFGCLLLVVAVSLASCGTSNPGEIGSHHLGLLAYLQGGSLWVKAVPNGQATRLTRHNHDRIWQPRWSPSGQWLAYRADNELWVVRRTGEDARVLSAAVRWFAWSPVSDTLAYTAHSGSLFIASAGEWRERELVANPGGQEGTGLSRMAWSPNGEWLAYGRTVWENGWRSLGLWRISGHGNDATQLFTPGTPQDEGIIVGKWSLDGQYILYWADLFSSSLMADGTSLHAFSSSEGAPRQLVKAKLAYDDFLASAPDGKHLGITVGADRTTWSNKRIAVAELSSGKLTYLTDDKTTALSPVWSPDSKRIVYVAAPDYRDIWGGEEARAVAARRRIWITNRDGSSKHQLTRNAAYQDGRPLWSADGRHILFARLHKNGRASLWLMRPDGRGLTQAVKDLSPAPHWFGYYGTIYWDWYFDWWTGSPR